MRRFLTPVLGATILLAATGAPAQEAKGKGLAVGESLPGPFHPYNVSGGSKDRYHCVVTDWGLDPVVLVFVNGVNPSRVGDLLTALDEAIARNPNARLHAAAVFLSDVNEIIGQNNENDDKRREQVAQLTPLGNSLKSVVVALGSRNDEGIQAYQLDPKAEATVVVYKAFKVLGIHKLMPNGDLDKLRADVAKDLTEKVGARKR